MIICPFDGTRKPRLRSGGTKTLTDSRTLGITGKSQPGCEGPLVFGSWGQCGIEQWHRDRSALLGVAWMVLRQPAENE